jgi:hypothetical protein
VKTPTALAVLAIASALALAAPAAAGSGTAFKGKTDRNQRVGFKLSGGKVKDFAATVFVICGDGDNTFNAVIPPKPLKVKGGKFSYKGRDRVDGANIEIRGSIKGGKAKGTVSMTDTNYSVTDQSIYACTSGTPKWTAKAK